MPGKPPEVEGAIPVVGDRAPEGRALPPARPEELSSPGEEIDHAEVHLQQPQGDRGPDRGLRRPALPWPGEESVDRQPCTARADHQRHEQHAERVIETEHIERSAVRGADQPEKRDEGRQRGREADGEEDRRHDGDAGEHANHRRRGGGKVAAPLPRLVIHAPDLVGPQPPPITEEGVGVEQPDDARPGEDQAGGDPNHGERKRIAGREPERVPCGGPFGEPAATALDRLRRRVDRSATASSRGQGADGGHRCCSAHA